MEEWKTRLVMGKKDQCFCGELEETIFSVEKLKINWWRGGEMDGYIRYVLVE